MNLLIRHNRELDEYPHFNKGTSSTVVMEKPHAAELLQEMRKQFTKSVMSIPKVTVNIGAALRHYKDSFNKKLGRELATSRIKPVEMTIESHPMFQSNPDALVLVLQGVDKIQKLHYYITVKIYRDSGDLRVISALTRAWE